MDDFSGAMPEIATLRALAEKARLTPDARRVALWCLDQLPPLYLDFSRTNESRFGDSITFRVKVALKRLGEPDPGDDAGRVADAFITKLGGLHERLGLAPLGLKAVTPPAPQPAKKKKAKAVAMPRAGK